MRDFQSGLVEQPPAEAHTEVPGAAEQPHEALEAKRLASPFGISAPALANRRLDALLRYGGTVLVLAITTGLLWPWRASIGLLNIGMVFLVVVVGITALAGRWAGILASLVGFIFFDFFLVPPYLTFAIEGLENLLALFVFLGVSALISWLIARAREQAWQAQRRAEDILRLYELSQTIMGTRSLDEVLAAITVKAAEVSEAGTSWLLLPDDRGRLSVRARTPEGGRLPGENELALAQQVYEPGGAKGEVNSTNTEHGPARPRTPGKAMNGKVANVLFVPLRAGGHAIGVLGIADRKGDGTLGPAEQIVLAAFAEQAAVALERLSLLQEAERAEILERTDELKSALMSAVSHDLRTPLASIMASVTSLLEPDMQWGEEVQQEFLEDIYEEAHRLNRLVGNLLDMSRIEGGALRPEKDWYSIAEIAEAVVQRLEPNLAGHPVRVDIQSNLPLVLLDFSEIEQVLTNLLENAVKYTPRGSPIRIGARQVDAVIEVYVEDSGPGVPHDELEHIFDKFYRTAQAPRGTGAGLGLAISKGLVEAHGGRIWACNNPAGGLTITFALPTGSADGQRTNEL